MSRRHYLKEIFNMDYHDLDVMYREMGTIKKVSDRLGVTERTIKNWFREGGITGIKHMTREHPIEKAQGLRKWIHEHQGERLPRSMKKISEITGFSKSLVNSYFHRRRRRLMRWLKSFPPLGELNVTLKEANGAFVPVKAIESYDFKIDPYTLAFIVYGRRKTGSVFAVRLTPKRWAALFATAEASPRPSEPALR